ncbi:hypothetical protein ACFQO1_04830 [Jejudonia soesokkakensis]|uniref:Uncharacterized protein n=1 Tax=Jejudonia soesokkakensis TaxID=1323432 RepID=A0ABW2MTX8_9FLAO
MKKILLAFVMLGAATSFAQNDKQAVQSMVDTFTSALEEREIFTYLTTTRYCDGNIQMIKMPNGRMCASKGTFYETYIFWQEEGKSYGKKIDNCGMFGSIELPDSEVYDYFTTHFEAIRSNPVKGYEIAQKETGPLQRTEINNCHKSFTLSNTDDTFSQKFNPFDLTNDAVEANIHYEYNQKLKIVHLDSLLDTAIKQIEGSANFIRI